MQTKPGAVVPLMLGHLEKADHRADPRGLNAIDPPDHERTRLASERRSPSVDRMIAKRTLATGEAPRHDPLDRIRGWTLPKTPPEGHHFRPNAALDLVHSSPRAACPSVARPSEGSGRERAS